MGTNTREDLILYLNDGSPLIPRSNLGHHLFLDRIVTNDLIYDLIFDASSARSLVCLLRTCRALHWSIRDYMTRAFSINACLSRYFTQPTVFRHLQACTGTVISGSTALQLFDRTYYPESDLDLYIPLAWRGALGQYLLQQGYRFVPNRMQKPNFEDAVGEKRVVTNKACYGNFKGIASVFTFRKKSTRGEKLQVQVIVAARSPMEVILRFHSTCVMNVITFDRAYCLYPRATLEERLSLVCTDRNDDVIEGVYNRYRQRGWTIVHSLDHVVSETTDPAFRHVTRWVEDGLTWTIRLPPLPRSLTAFNAQSSALSHDPISISSWTIDVGKSTPEAYMKFYYVSCPQLFYSYTIEHTACLYTREMSYLLDMAEDANTGLSGLVPHEDRHYVDDRFIQLCRKHYRAMF